MTASLLGLATVLLLALLRLPIAFSMGIVGYVGFGLLVHWGASASMVAGAAQEAGFNYSLSVIPLFILMGNFVTRAGLSKDLYDAANAYIGHRRGGLAMATILACGGFSAVCGSSMATAATMVKVAMPSMRARGYSDALAAGSVASGGTLGILIPPSVILVLYGIMTEQDIGLLFIAGLLPGLLGVLLYLGAVATTTWLEPRNGPPGDRQNWLQRLRSLKRIWGVLLLFVIIIGGIYTGIFTPTEAAGVGAAGAFLLACVFGKMTWRSLISILVETGRTTTMIFFVLIGALIFSNFINVAGFPVALSGWVMSLDVSPMMVILCIVAIYLVLGAFLESLSMILLTVPVFYPLVSALDFGGFMDPSMVLIWFGIVVVVVTEISLITPPVGMNVFVLKAVIPGVSAKTIFKGVTPFWLADIVRLAFLLAFPSISLVLPLLMVK